MTQQYSIAVASLLLLSSAGCGQRSGAPAPLAADRPPLQAVAGEDEASAGRQADPGAKGDASGTALDSMAAARKLIRTGLLELEVADYAEAAQKATRLVESRGGYVADSRVDRSPNDRRHGRMTLRIPAERYAPTFEELKTLGKARAESSSAQDVTKAYTDLETRLRVKRETADRLRVILKTNAARLSDILETERELARVTEEIERLEGERRYYDQQIALSTISLTLSEPDAIVRSGILDPVRKALRGSLQLLSVSIAFLIAAVVVLAPWVLALLVVIWLVRRIRARRLKRARQTVS
jgi:hypothetical protein